MRVAVPPADLPAFMAKHFDTSKAAATARRTSSASSRDVTDARRSRTELMGGSSSNNSGGGGGAPAVLRVSVYSVQDAGSAGVALPCSKLDLQGACHVPVRDLVSKPSMATRLGLQGGRGSGLFRRSSAAVELEARLVPRWMCLPLRSTLPLAVATYRVGATGLVELLEEAPVAVSVPSEWLRWRVFCLQRAQHRLQARMERAHARGDGHGDTAANSTLRHIQGLIQRYESGVRNLASGLLTSSVCVCVCVCVCGWVCDTATGTLPRSSS